MLHELEILREILDEADLRGTRVIVEELLPAVHENDVSEDRVKLVLIQVRPVSLVLDLDAHFFRLNIHSLCGSLSLIQVNQLNRAVVGSREEDLDRREGLMLREVYCEF